jgi:hypothetical protein
MDTGTSPSKNKDELMSDAEKIAKRRLEFGEGVGNNALAIIPSGMMGKGPMIIPEEEKEDSTDSKRQRKEDGTSVSNNSARSAASLEDDRRAQ